MGSDAVDAAATASMCQAGAVRSPKRSASMSEVSTTGLDLAKEAFQEHGADAAGAVVFEASAGLLSCNFLQLKRRAGLRWKPARLHC